MSISEFAGTLNHYGAHKIPFLFFVDFEMQKARVFALRDIDPVQILYEINGYGNAASMGNADLRIDFLMKPASFADYKKKFDKVRAHLLYGDSYLTNLTMKTEVETGLSLKQIFGLSRAKYKLWYEDRFLVFSPESFVQIRDGVISSFPMKGTIDANLPNAAELLLKDVKEKAEHTTIVDLIRNDLSAVAKDVEVVRFRYVERITTLQKALLQVSSEIRGVLPPGHMGALGDILVSLLPAGSVSGAPKRKTLEIIRSAEEEPRGYYTGVLGLFDGKTLDSGVMIRFMERSSGKVCYRSGGGITVQSVAETEYQEVLDKIYVPVD